jgi:hypothetical protein
MTIEHKERSLSVLSLACGGERENSRKQAGKQEQSKGKDKKRAEHATPAAARILADSKSFSTVVVIQKPKQRPIFCV